MSKKRHKCKKKKGKTKSFNICAFGMGWWPNSAFVLNKNEVEHLPQLKCILGTQKSQTLFQKMDYCSMIMQKRWAD